ncbi:uncharacterized protein LOC582189 [Strongylocentrotus purpuratus]|uniref:Uncharacterized protein n=1 Tax=Strongylocentrotus purpuratus TaxID=7668 RepID=A0A7M7HGN1_STRPU|nr:uncharacterized protein LOC582189 [Strongylocentrotus purpuratus]
MHTRKRRRNVIAILNQDPLKTFLLKCSTIVIAFTLLPHCKAKCSVPTASFAASRDSQSLYSPNHPDSYPDATTCSWLITSSPLDTGLRIQLRVVYDNFSCCCDNDYLVIKDGSDFSARSIAILCSDLNPISITSSGPNIYGEFRSDDDGQTGLGYTLEFNYFDSKVSCPPYWIGRNGYCYKLYDDASPWQQAASRCGYDGGFLTSIVDEEENDFLVGSFRNQTSLVWIGMDLAGNWLDGSSSLLYNNFGNEPASTVECSAIDLDDNGRWRRANCVDQQFWFICKKTQDGSGERYWTEVVISDDESSANGFSAASAVAIIIACFFLFSCLRSRSNNNNNNDNCFAQLVTCICKGITECVAVVWRAIEFCLSCRWLGCAGPSEETRTGGTPSGQNPEINQQHVSLEEVRTSRRNSTSQWSSDPSQSPPAYGEVISEPPPPSYNEALAPQFDGGPTTDNGGSSLSLNIGDAIAAPSYESVIGSEGNI